MLDGNPPYFSLFVNPFRFNVRYTYSLKSLVYIYTINQSVNKFSETSVEMVFQPRSKDQDEAGHGARTACSASHFMRFGGHHGQNKLFVK